MTGMQEQVGSDRHSATGNIGCWLNLTASIAISLQMLTVVMTVTIDFAISRTEVSSIPLGSMRSMAVSFYKDLGRDRKQDLLASAECGIASWSLVSPANALSLFIVHPSQDYAHRLVDGLYIGLSDRPATHHLRLGLTAFVLELALQHHVSHHGH